MWTVIGIDFLCSLITGNNGEGLLKAGPFFAVQAKRPSEKLTYEKQHELEWITNQENPLLLCFADRKEAAIDVYSTWNLLCGVLGGGWEGKIKPKSITLRPGESGDWPGVRNHPDGSQEILLGKGMPDAYVKYGVGCGKMSISDETRKFKNKVMLASSWQRRQASDESCQDRRCCIWKKDRKEKQRDRNTGM